METIHIAYTSKLAKRKGFLSVAAVPLMFGQSEYSDCNFDFRSLSAKIRLLL